MEKINIGERKEVICSAIKVFNINTESLSENRNEYWISSLSNDFNVDFTIQKDSEDGKEIAEKINQDLSEEEWDFYFFKLVLKYASSQQVKNGIERIKDQYFLKGRNAMQSEIRITLGFRE